MKTVIVFLAILFASSFVEAQTTINVDIARASLAWDWTQGAGGLPDSFNVKCGQSSGNYTKVTSVAYPTLTVAISQVITGQGSWFCVVSASNQFGDSPNSEELPFVAGAAPLSPSNARVIAK